MLKYLIICSIILVSCSKNTQNPITPENKIERKDEAIWNVSTIEANDLDFGIVGAKESRILSVQIKNDGTEDIIGTPIISNSHFSILTSNCVNLLKNKSCVIKINFNAQGKELNNYTANLNFGSYVNIISAEIDRPLLSGDSYFALNNSISSFDYGTITYNQNILKTFRIVNNGQTILNKNLTSSSSNFQVVYDQCSGKNLEPKKHCIFKVLLTGQNKNGAVSAQLEYNEKYLDLLGAVKSRSDVSEELGILTSVHNGQEYSADIDYGTINLNTVSLKSIYLKNTGTGSLVINNITIDAPVTIINNYCNNSYLNPNQTCLIRTRIDANVKNNYEVNIASDLGHIVKNQKILYSIKEPGDKVSCVAQIPNASIANLTWNGNSYSSCVVEACNPSYHINDNACDLDVISCQITNGEGTQSWSGSEYGSCLVSSCELNFHEENNQCLSDTKSCLIDNGSGSQIWNGTGYNSCIANSCDIGYHVESGLCLSNSKSCVGTNGSGTQMWNGTSYDSCVLNSCDQGFILNNGTCQSGIVVNGSGRKWADGTFASSCNQYKNPANGYSYSGLTGDGLYTIKPDATQEFNVYCDMTTDSSGWTLAFAGGMSSSPVNPSTSIYSGTSVENHSFNVMGVTLTTQSLMKVINKVVFKNIRFGTAKWLESSTTSTFSQKYSARTSWSSHNCQTSYLGVPRGSVAGWDVSISGAYTRGSALLGCTTGAGDPSTPQDGGTLDYSLMGLNVYAQATGAACDQGGCNVYHLLGTAEHRSAVPFSSSSYMQNKSYLIWIK